MFYDAGIAADSMATKQSTVDYILDQLADIPGIKARKMFGEYALYAGGKVVGLICDDTVFIKITDEGKEILGSDYKEGLAYPGAKASMEIPEDFLEDRERFLRVIKVTEKNLPKPKAKKR